jgi:hypothetical protein
VHLVRVATVCHGGVAEHALKAGVDNISRLAGARLGLRCHGRVLVDIGHGGDGGAAGAGAGEGPSKRRAWRGRLDCERGAAGMQAAWRWCRTSRAGARAGGLGVEQDELGHGGRLILSNDDAAVAGELEIDLGQRSIVAAARGDGCSMEGIWLTVGVGEGAGVGIEQMARVRLLGCRLEARRRGRAWHAAPIARPSACALATAEELADHGRRLRLGARATSLRRSGALPTGSSWHARQAGWRQ